MIAYTHRYSGARFEIHTLDIHSGKISALTRDGGQNTDPSWSPNCRLVVYSAGRRGLWTITADGERKWQIYRGTAHAPAWSEY
jgi:Tol biopolymer transport system component